MLGNWVIVGGGALIALVLAFVALTVMALAAFVHSRYDPMFFVPFWCLVFFSAFNLPAPLFYLAYGSRAAFLGPVTVDDVATGLMINLAFIIAWCVGYYSSILRHLPRRSPARHWSNEVMAAGYALLGIAVLAKGWQFLRPVSYGYVQKLYQIGSDISATLGPISFFSSLFIPVVVALAIAHSQRRQARGERGVGLIPLVLLGGVLAVGAIGVLTDVKRAPLMESGAAVLFAMVYLRRLRAAVVLAVAGFLAVAVVSPAIDQVRVDLASKRSTSVLDAIEATVLGTNATKLRDELAARAIKGNDAATTAVLYKWTQFHDHVGLGSFATIIPAVIPRAIDPDKPYPLAYDGTYKSYAPQFVGILMRNLGTTYWVSGAGVHWWYLGWAGVILGGGLVGALWASIARAAFRRSSFFFLVFFFVVLGYGWNLITPLDALLLTSLRVLLYFGGAWLVLTAVVRLNSRQHWGPRARIGLGAN